MITRALVLLGGLALLAGALSHAASGAPAVAGKLLFGLFGVGYAVFAIVGLVVGGAGLAARRGARHPRTR